MSLIYQEIELEATPIPKDQLEIISFVLAKVENDEYSLFEIMMSALILARYNYVTIEDYSVKVSLYGEKQTFIDISKEALELNNY
jgi:hypothetical protein